MIRRYGWGPRSSRVHSSIPYGHWQSSTFIAALRTTGLCAPMVLEGAMNGECFLTWVRQFLVPEFRPGDLVVMDNLSCHKQEAVQAAIHEAGAEALHLPPYSPDLNPIEQVFSKLKTLLRRHAERTKEALWRRIGALLDEFTPDECQNYIQHCGYRAQ